MHKTTEIPSLKTNLLITGKLKAYHCFKVHLLKIEKKNDLPFFAYLHAFKPWSKTPCYFFRKKWHGDFSVI